MTLGGKIKRRRLALQLTQAQLAGDQITRNMLSLIESDRASPSVQTLQYLAERLKLPAGFFLSDEEDSEAYRRARAIAGIRQRLQAKDYATCVELCSAFAGQEDDELHLILCYCFSAIGEEELQQLRFDTAVNAFGAGIFHAAASLYDGASHEETCRYYLFLLAALQKKIRADGMPSPQFFYDLLQRHSFFSASYRADLSLFTAIRHLSDGEDFAEPTERCRLFLFSAMRCYLNGQNLRALQFLKEADDGNADFIVRLFAADLTERICTSQADFDAAFSASLRRDSVLAAIASLAEASLHPL